MQSVYRSNKTLTHALIVTLGIAIIATTAYLTNHYFAIKFPDGLGSASALCDISGFLNCDAATHSPISNIAGIPISIFGFLIGILLLAGYLFNSPGYESTMKFILTVNLIGCVVLFIYSVASLGSLCPMCTLYYLLSFGAFFIFNQNIKSFRPTIVPIISVGVLFAATSVGAYMYTAEKAQKNEALATSLIQQFDSLPDLGAPAEQSMFRLVSSTEDFQAAPIQVTKFSDFQCPACKAMSEQLHKAARQYKGQINIQYMFYPLDPACNATMERSLHPFACKAAYLAYCLPEKFPEIENELFSNQDSLSDSFIEGIAKRENVVDCYKAEDTKEKVKAIVSSAAPFNIRSTPTVLLNGVKIEGVLPFNQLQVLMDELVTRSTK
ncbi:MAG: hypothetical protein COW01_13170 [Bdellovibrionales bacterium CG12_big_fil_rev_8_21_14_0_65_38_15]|nr:MAG: hypothetical protein COW79_06060 [Bdellovibrionales bacterium CG22_combo_CG10-13_8_21_14_all_38_13]PIQ53573.1 MAG: hypothetical protein COW01_13170 [Bdellovibrionales bacterium CG12_big_fil_rev_8_21_14_0_65_38_15]PIR28423.1 MAG: hypothetical protein COV38_15470 [Bdellovibrionales bacterium CG11_big_fil_rev_8_21_14_0_20_38_13]